MSQNNHWQFNERLADRRVADDPSTHGAELLCPFCGWPIVMEPDHCPACREVLDGSDCEFNREIARESNRELAGNPPQPPRPPVECGCSCHAFGRQVSTIEDLVTICCPCYTTTQAEDAEQVALVLWLGYPWWRA